MYVVQVRDEMRMSGVEPVEHPNTRYDNGNCTSNAFFLDTP